MREIKFRQPLLDDNGRFLEWHYWGFRNKSFVGPSNAWTNGNISQQFTGLKDKNGKEIYESDLLKRLDGEIDEVVFDGGCFCVKHKAGDMDLISAHNNFEIVGNVYER